MNLPFPLLHKIAQKLSLPDLAEVCISASSHFNKIYNDDKFWKGMTLKTQPLYAKKPDVWSSKEWFIINHVADKILSLSNQQLAQLLETNLLATIRQKATETQALELRLLGNSYFQISDPIFYLNQNNGFNPELEDSWLYKLYPELKKADFHPIYIHQVEPTKIRILDVEEQIWRTAPVNENGVYARIIALLFKLLPIRQKFVGYKFGRIISCDIPLKGQRDIFRSSMSEIELMTYLSQFDIYPNDRRSYSKLNEYLAHAFLIHEQMIFWGKI